MIVAVCHNNHAYDINKYSSCPFCKEVKISNPTGDALMARIKELEEALKDMLDLVKDIWDNAENEQAVINARKALNK